MMEKLRLKISYVYWFLRIGIPQDKALVQQRLYMYGLEALCCGNLYAYKLFFKQRVILLSRGHGKNEAIVSI